MIRKYHNHKPQTTPWHRAEEPPNHHETSGRHIEQSNQLSLPHQGDCNTIMDINKVQQNIEQLQTPTMGVKINKKSTTSIVLDQRDKRCFWNGEMYKYTS